MTNLTADLYVATAKRVTDREVGAARLAPDYAALVEHFGLTHDTPSADLTDVARTIVVDGANALANNDTARTLTADMLKGQNPGADAAHVLYWRAARAVRIGLVTAMGDKKSAPKDATLRVSLSGEGGGSSVVPMDSDLGKAILAFLNQSGE